MAIFQKGLRKMTEKDWIKKVKSVHPKADEQVLQFIYDFRTMQKSEAAEDAIYTQFESGYCYYFAHMLKLAFKRGEVCWAAPYGHMVWVDDDGIPYDISGVDDSDTNDYIPEYMMESTVKDFRHVPGVVNNTTDQKIAQMVLDWHDIKSEMFGGDVTKFSLKEANKFIKSFTIYEEDFGGIYQKKKKYLKRKFKIKEDKDE